MKAAATKEEKFKNEPSPTALTSKRWFMLVLFLMLLTFLCKKQFLQIILISVTNPNPTRTGIQKYLFIFGIARIISQVSNLQTDIRRRSIESIKSNPKTHSNSSFSFRTYTFFLFHISSCSYYIRLSRT